MSFLTRLSSRLRRGVQVAKPLSNGKASRREGNFTPWVARFGGSGSLCAVVFSSCIFVYQLVSVGTSGGLVSFGVTGGSHRVSRRSVDMLERSLASLDEILSSKFADSCQPCIDRRGCPTDLVGKSLEGFIEEQSRLDHSCRSRSFGRCCNRISDDSRARIRVGVLDQLRPFISDGVRKRDTSLARKLAFQQQRSVFVQVLRGKIYLEAPSTSQISSYNFSCCSAQRNDLFRGNRLGRAYSPKDGLGDLVQDNPRTRLMLRHFLLQLQAFVNLRQENTPNFELVFSPSSAALFPDETVDGFQFPTWGVLWRHDRATFTFPRHDGTKDVDLSHWDQYVEKRACLDHVNGRDLKSTWDSKISQAVFRGSFITRALSHGFSYSRDIGPARKITKSNWNNTGRAALLAIQKEHSDLFNVNFFDLPMERMKKYDIRIAYLGKPPTEMTLDEQLSKYNILLGVEGGDGWCEYLRYLLFSRSLVIKQETPFGEWFEKLLPPSAMRATDSDWLNLTAVVNQTVNNADRAITDVTEARSAIVDLVSVEGQAVFASLLFEGYARLMDYNPRRLKSARPIECELSKGTCQWSTDQG